MCEAEEGVLHSSFLPHLTGWKGTIIDFVSERQHPRKDGRSQLCEREGPSLFKPS